MRRSKIRGDGDQGGNHGLRILVTNPMDMLVARERELTMAHGHTAPGLGHSLLLCNHEPLCWRSLAFRVTQ